MPDQQPIEMILLRQLAAYLALPIWMMDEAGNLLYYNAPAEKLLGATFDDVGPIHAEELGALFQTSQVDDPGRTDVEIPVVTALRTRHPAHGPIRFCGLDGVWREVDISALPIEGQGGRFLGVVAAFFEVAD
ncbi:MAG TPA: PAS domain-containing protein [Acidimicrobiia bacterium]